VSATGRRSVAGLVVVGVGLALLIGMVAANFAAGTPDALQRSVIDSACKDAADQESCLAEKEGEPVWTSVPEALNGYTHVSLSGLVGVVATFVLGAGLIWVLRRGRARGDEPRARD
jgi:cobalt/nickel transport system permease protein